MIIERKEFQTRTELQTYLNQKAYRLMAGYDLKPGQKLQEVVDYEMKKGPIKTIIVLR
jgi:hypothetical protein